MDHKSLFKSNFDLDTATSSFFLIMFLKLIYKYKFKYDVFKVRFYDMFFLFHLFPENKSSQLTAMSFSQRFIISIRKEIEVFSKKLLFVLFFLIILMRKLIL